MWPFTKRHFLTFSLVFFLTAKVSHLAALDLDFKLNENDAYYGLSLGQSQLKTGSNNFRIQNQDFVTDIKDKNASLSSYFGIPFSTNFSNELGVEFSAHILGDYEFAGILTGNTNLGTTEGEQSFYGLGTSVFYQKDFQHFSAKAHTGFMYVRLTVDGKIDIVGQTQNQSLSYSENSGNIFFGIEASKKVYKDWHLAPSFTYFNTGDPIQNFSLKITHSVENL